MIADPCVHPGELDAVCAGAEKPVAPNGKIGVGRDVARGAAPTRALGAFDGVERAGAGWLRLDASQEGIASMFRRYRRDVMPIACHSGGSPIMETMRRRYWPMTPISPQIKATQSTYTPSVQKFVAFGSSRGDRDVVSFGFSGGTKRSA